MLIYCSSFQLEPIGGPRQIIDLIARWIGQKSKSYVDPVDLAMGMQRRLKDGSNAESRTTQVDSTTPTFPYFFCARFSHGQEGVPGRLWSTEVGLHQVSEGATVLCTFLLKTDEVSARVLAPVQVTRPRIALDIVSACRPTAGTTGFQVKRLDEGGAPAFLAEVERAGRESPIVVVSATREGKYLVEPERMRSLLVGIADVVQVATGVNTFELEKVLGRRYGAWGGAVNILFQSRVGHDGPYCATSLYLPDRLNELAEAGIGIDSEILSAVTHRTNLPCSWRHVSLETVSHASLRARLARTLDQAKQSDNGSSYIPLLESAMDQLGERDSVIDGLREDLRQRDDRIVVLESSVTGLKHALSGRQHSGTEPDADELDALQPLREAVSAVISGQPSLEQSLTIIATFFPDRIVILESAYESARESKGFQFGKKAFDLLWTLANDYWNAVANGGGDLEGKKTFGQNAYAQNEAQALSNDGKRWRTFDYKGQDLLMEKHLKIGIKPSVAETLRVHFEWVGVERVIVVGHCGKHLNF